MEEMLEILERLLKATGYVFSGKLEIVDDDVEDKGRLIAVFRD
jgi:hypothetical protein